MRRSYPAVSGCDCRPPAARVGGPRGFGTRGRRRKRRRERKRKRRRKRRAGERTSGRAGAQRGEAASGLPSSVTGEFSAQASRVPSLSLGALLSGASPQGAREARGLPRPNLVRAASFSSPRAAPGPGFRPWGSSRPPHSNFAGTRVPLQPRHSVEPRAGGNGGTFWHRLLPPADSPRLGDAGPWGIGAPAQPQL